MKRIEQYKKIYEYFKDKKKLIFFYFLLATCTSIIGFLNPYISSKVIIYVTNINTSKLLFYSLLIVILGIVSLILDNYTYRLSTKIKNEVSLKIKEEASKELFNIEVKNFDKEGTSYFTNIINTEPEAISGIFGKMERTFTKLLTNSGVFIYIFVISWQIGLLFIILSIIDAIVMKFRMKDWTKYRESLKNLESKYSSNFSELIRGIRDIKVLNLKKVLLNKTVHEQRNYKNELYEFDKRQDRKRFYIHVLDYLADFLVLMIGIILISQEKFSGEYLLIIYMYRSKAFSALRNISDVYEQINQFNFSIDRLYGLIDGNKFSKEKYGNKYIKDLKGNISIKNLSFGYEDNLVLKNLNLEIKEKTTVGFVGKSGQGKTTIFNLLSKLYVVEDGMIFYDDIDINELSEKSIRENISVIIQNPYIFNKSIRDNIMIANENLTENEMIEICKMCDLDEFIKELPDGYNTLIGENGIILSGGQKQRLAIARAIAKNSNIILFDEATSSLDNETQDYIQKSINNLSKKYTILIIAHRLSTVRDCDKIFFVDKGKILAEGTHEELVNNCKEYRNLYKKELNN